MKTSLTIKSSAIYLILGIMALVFAYPFYNVFVLATWPSQQLLRFPPHFFFGPGLVENWNQLFTRVPYHVNFFNSVGIAFFSVILPMFFCTMGGYAFAKYDFKGKKAIFTFVLATMAIPGFLNLIPFYKMMATFKWINTWLPLIIPGMANAFGIFLMTQYLENSIPDELLDAARIDGLSEFGILRRIVFPLAKPGLSVLAMSAFVGSWNNFTGALIFIPTLEKTTLPVALSVLASRVDNNMGAMMLGNAIALLPIMVVFIFFSKQIIAGLTAGAVKG